MKTDPLVDTTLDQCFTVDISILRRMEARLNLIVFCFILMTHFQGQRSLFVNADANADPRIKHRQFISKARANHIKVRTFWLKVVHFKNFKSAKKPTKFL